MKTPLPFILIGILLFAAQSPGQEKTLPPIVARGFDQFRENGPLAAVGVWLAGSVRETDDTFQDDATARMKRAQDAFGRMTGYETVRVVTLSASVVRVYAVVKFEKSVAWMSFDCYKPANDWIITRFDFQMKPGDILPPNILGGL